MTNQHLTLVVNNELFNTTQEEFEKKLALDLENGKETPIFMYDEDGKYKGLNEMQFSIAAIRLLGKLCTQGRDR